MKKYISKIACLITSCILLIVLLTSCTGENYVKVKNTDGTATSIKYINHAILVRAPYFTHNEKSVIMQFNGTEWYVATIIDEVEKEKISKQLLVAESSNIKVYKNDEESEYSYTYIIDLDGTDISYISITNDDHPENPQGYGSYFDYQISYYVDNIETIPDMEWEIFVPAEYPDTADYTEKVDIESIEESE